MYALKIVPKNLAYGVEKEVFDRAVGHPFLVQLLGYLKTSESVYYMMEYCEGGTLGSLMSRLQRFDEDMVRFYAAEIILAVKFLHKCGIVHRDIKPTNILLDRDGHCKLADFGLSEVGMFKGKQTVGVCGTVRYMAPEIKPGRLYGPEVDWWSVGCIMFDMMVGDCPAEDLLYPEEYPLCLKKDAVSILNMLLEPNPIRRLGARGDTRSIMRHPFFKTVKWKAVLKKRVAPPLKLLNLDSLTVDAEVPGDACDLGRNPSNEHTHCEAIIEQPPLQQLTLNYLTDDEGAPSDASDLGRNPSNEQTHCVAIVEQPPLQQLTLDYLTDDEGATSDACDRGRSPSNERTHCDATVEKPPLQPQTLDCLTVDTEAPVKRPTVDSRASGKMKKLVTVAAAAAVVFSFVLLGNVLYNFYI